MSRSKAPIFNPEQFKFLLDLMPECTVSVQSSKEEFIVEHLKREYRNTIKNLMEKQGYGF